MTHAPAEAVLKHRLPAAQSQGFVHVHVVTYSDPYSTGPLAVPAELTPSELAALAQGLPLGPVARGKEPAAG